MQTKRQTARALIINEQQEILLISVALPWMTSPTWTMPGGGIEPGETASECARREIQEETGFHYRGELTPCWHGTIVFDYKNKRYEVEEQYFVARVTERFTPSTQYMLDYEKDFTLELAWCRHADLVDAHCSPRPLPTLLERVRNNDLPQQSELITNLMPANYLKI